MKRDLFRRYVWLVNVVRHAKSITFEEISELWEKSPMNIDRSSLALRTFHNHREAIAQLFGIHILCNRSDHEYYILENTDISGETKLRVWMLQTLSQQNLSSEDAADIGDRIVLDTMPEEKYGLTSIIEAMKNGNIITVRYPEVIGESVLRAVDTIEPYCLRFWHYGWYLLGKDTSTGKLKIYSLSRMLQVEIHKEKFVYPRDFSPRQYFFNYFGVDVDSDRQPENIRIRIKGPLRQHLRIAPLHVSQREILTEPDSSIFDYCLVPSDEFVKAILGMGHKAEVISPSSLRKEIQAGLRKSLSLYV